MKKKGKLKLQSDMSDIKPKQEFSGSAAKDKKLPESVKTCKPGVEFGGGNYK